MPMLPFRRLVLILVLSLAAADAFAQAPLWPSRVHYPLLDVKAAPPTATRPALDEGPWKQAHSMQLWASGRPEPTSRPTSIKMLTSGGTLYVAAACKGDSPDKLKVGKDRRMLWRDDCLELFISPSKDRPWPALHVQINPAGVVNLKRIDAPPLNTQADVGIDLDLSLVKSTAGSDAEGWWATLELPMDRLGIPAKGFAMNAGRGRPADGTFIAWSDLWAGSFLNIRRLGLVEQAQKAGFPVKLGKSLGIGRNLLEIEGYEKGMRLLVDGRPCDDLAPVITAPGPVEIVVLDSAGRELAAYAADVRRPVSIQLSETFVADVPANLKVAVSLAIASTNKADVTLRAEQNGKVIGESSSLMGAQEPQLIINLPLKGAKAGEVTVTAKAVIHVENGKPLAESSAFQTCILGGELGDFAKPREGFEKMPLTVLLRTTVADAANIARIQQLGDGRFHKSGDIWAQGALYAVAFVYKTKWPKAENPYFGDKRFLASAAAGLDCCLTPERRHEFLNHPDNRTMHGMLLTYDLLKDDVPKEQAAAWRRGLTEQMQAVVDIWMKPVQYRLTRYSEDCGTGTNHWALHASNVHLAGRVLDDKEWVEIGRREMTALMHHGRDGVFAERRAIPTPSYNSLTAQALGQYATLGKDPTAMAKLAESTRFITSVIQPDLSLPGPFDGRNNGGRQIDFHLLPLIFDKQGRTIAHQAVLRAQASPRGLLNFQGERLMRLAEAAREITEDSQEPLPTASDFSFMDGRALSVRKDGFQYNLSAMHDHPVEDLFRLDAQNALSLVHTDGGQVLLGQNSQNQPEAGTFMRKAGGKDGKYVFLPLDGEIQRTLTGHYAKLRYDGFTAGVNVEIKSPTQAVITAQLVKAEGDEPATFNFFPAGLPADVKLSDDGKTLTFGKVTIQCNHPISLQKDLKLYNPYSGKYAMPIKPVRASATLRIGEPFEMTVAIANSH